MTTPLDFMKLRVFPLSKRKSLTRVQDILVDPESTPQALAENVQTAIERCARQVEQARARGAAVVLIYGAHLLRNGAALILERMMARGLITHIATNGAGTIHDWEYAWLGASTESVRENVANGTFGLWRETSVNIHLALMTGALERMGYGRSLGRYILEDGVLLPEPEQILAAVRELPEDPLIPPSLDLLHAMREQGWKAGLHKVEHRFKQASILAQAYRHKVPATVHPGIGYDIITNHPIFSGSVIGRAADLDFKLFAGALEGLDGGVVLSVGSAIMGPQVFEKALACVNNIRLAEWRPIVRDHALHVVDLQDSGGWDWTQGEPPKTNPAYYLRFCKSYARMGGELNYHQCDNLAFIHHLWKRLAGS